MYVEGIERKARNLRDYVKDDRQRRECEVKGNRISTMAGHQRLPLLLDLIIQDHQDIFVVSFSCVKHVADFAWAFNASCEVVFENFAIRPRTGS